MKREEAIQELEKLIEASVSSGSGMDQSLARGYARALFHLGFLSDLEFYKFVDRILGLVE